MGTQIVGYTGTLLFRRFALGILALQLLLKGLAFIEHLACITPMGTTYRTFYHN